MKTMTLLPVLLALSSCVVESPVPVRRSAEVLLDYTVSGLVPMALTEPVAAVRSLSSQDGQVDRNGIVWNVECIEEGKWRLDFSAGYEKNASADVLVQYAGGEPEKAGLLSRCPDVSTRISCMTGRLWTTATSNSAREVSLRTSAQTEGLS